MAAIDLRRIVDLKEKNLYAGQLFNFQKKIKKSMTGTEKKTV